MEQEKENSIQLSTATAPTMKQPRNCAFDIARIVAMFLIVSSHFLGHGGFANNMTGANFVFGRILTSLFNPSVNLFVLIGATSLARQKNSNGNALQNSTRKCGYIV